MSAADEEPGRAVAGSLSAWSIDRRFPGGARRPVGEAGAEPVAGRDRAADGGVASGLRRLAEVRPLSMADTYTCGRTGSTHPKMALVAWRTRTWRVQIVKRSDATGFEALPKRWTVERTFAWIGRNRRWARDFERYATTVIACVRLANSS
jgi:hypothetical protein